MREIKFLAGLSTLFIFAAVFCFKAAFGKKPLKENTVMAKDTPGKKYEKVLLLFFGGLCLIAGVFLITKLLALV